MTLRYSFLIGRAAVFAALLVTAGATSIAVASGAGDARPQSIADNAEVADFDLAAASGTSARPARGNVRL